MGLPNSDIPNHDLAELGCATVQNGTCLHGRCKVVAAGRTLTAALTLVVQIAAEEAP